MSTARKTGESSRFVADFETVNKPDDCRVWLWALTDIFPEDEYRPIFGTDLQSFIDYISKLRSVIYFHNLAFDGSFILDYLLRDGYVHTKDKMRRGDFTTLISRDNKFYSIKVFWRDGGRTEFRDSLKKLPMSVSAISKAFHLEESKGEIDYNAERPVGYVPSADEIDYVTNDVVIVAQAIRQQLNAGMKSLTVGADSLREFKEISGKSFDRLFPVLPLDVDADIRRAYRGGFTYADPKFSGKITRGGRVYDVNSLYPSVMYQKLLPYGEPSFKPGPPVDSEEFPLYVTTITFKGKIKRGKIPCIQLRASSHFIPTAYLTEIPELETVSLTNVDLKLWQDHYNLNIVAYHGTWYFKGATGMFKEYVDKWNAVKVQSRGGMRVIAKLHLNSLYGKFATNPDVTGKIPVLEKDVVRLVEGEEETRDPVYTPMGVFITAYARDITIRAAQANRATFAYADTDSLHLLVDRDPPGLDIDPDRMGSWKHELTFDAAFYARAKCYTERDSDGRYHTHIAGLPTAVADTLTFADFLDGKRFRGKLTPCRVPGGIVLRDVGFTLKI